MNMNCINQKSKIIYISGAITGTDDYMKRFAIAEELLKGQGYNKVINPAAVCARLPQLEHADYMSVCLTMIALSDIVYVLDGWEQSKGSKMEISAAKKLGKQVAYEL